ncbi:MAG: N,N-dimethylformamidase beta subunit family domain-containing protein, partial [Acidimicrobiales bacterium]
AGGAGATTSTTLATLPAEPPFSRAELSAAIVAENKLPGSSDWNITDPAKGDDIEGYANEESIKPGDPVTLYVSTVAPTYKVEVFRMGWYQGLGARLIGTSTELTGQVQAKPVFTSGTNMIETFWQQSVDFDTGSWPPGDYLFKLVASTGPESWIPLTVRSPNSTAAYVIVNAVTTWQAYNLWGGYNLYQGSDGAYADRSRVVSFDRPYAEANGAADFLGLEYPLLRLAESLGLDVTYMTDIDLAATTNPLLGHKAVFSLGHDEYYSLSMRTNVQDARDNGVNLGFLGANAMFRHIRLTDSPLGPDREVICYKNANEDPLYGTDNADVTVDWRDPPTDNPESQIIGDYYQCNPVHADMVIADPENWLFAGTGVVAGQVLPGVIATEYDRYDPNVPSPPDVEILTHSPLRCGGQQDDADSTYYTAPGGAGVFAAGTIAFIPNIDPNCQPTGTPPACNGQILSKVVENLLAAFGAGPAGKAHPSNPSESTVVEPPPTIVSYEGVSGSAVTGRSTTTTLPGGLTSTTGGPQENAP